MSLAGLGLLVEAGRRHAELARALPQGEARGAALAQAAELAASADDFVLAAGHFEEAARSPGHARLLEKAADNYERSGRFDDVIRVLGERQSRYGRLRSRPSTVVAACRCMPSIVRKYWHTTQIFSHTTPSRPHSASSVRYFHVLLL